MDIDFNHWFPALKWLHVTSDVIVANVHHMPRNLDFLQFECTATQLPIAQMDGMLRCNTSLRELHLDRVPIDPNLVIDKMYELGMHETLETFEYDNEKDRRFVGKYELTSALSKFVKLHTLAFHFPGNLSAAKNLPIFKSLQKMRELTIPLYGEGNSDLPANEFLNRFAKNAPPYLRELTINSDFKVDEKPWAEFVEAMPSCVDWVNSTNPMTMNISPNGIFENLKKV